MKIPNGMRDYKYLWQERMQVVRRTVPEPPAGRPQLLESASSRLAAPAPRLRALPIRRKIVQLAHSDGRSMTVNENVWWGKRLAAGGCHPCPY